MYNVMCLLFLPLQLQLDQAVEDVKAKIMETSVRMCIIIIIYYIFIRMIPFIISLPYDHSHPSE